MTDGVRDIVSIAGNRRRAAAARQQAQRTAQQTRALLIALAIAAIGIAALMAVPAPSASAAPADGANLKITEVDTSKYPFIRVGFIKDDESQSIPSLSLTENDKGVESFNAFFGEIGQTTVDESPAIMLAIDASDSMKGDKIAAAKQAALMLVDQAREGDMIGVATFGESSAVLVEPTDDLVAVRSAIEGITLSRGTATYDAILGAADAFPDSSSRKAIVLLSDGVEVGSSASQEEAIDATNEAGAEIYAVGIDGRGFEAADLKTLASSTQGEFEKVADASDLTALYATLGQELLRSYWLEYQSTLSDAKNIEIAMTADGFSTATGTYRVPAIETGSGERFVPGVKEAEVSDPLISMPDSALGRLIAVLPFGLAIAFWVLANARAKGRPTPEKRILPYVETKRDPLEAAAVDNRVSLKERLFKSTDNVMGRSGLFAKFKRMLEQANLPLRPVELLYLSMIVGSLFAFLGLIVWPGPGLIFGGLLGLLLPSLIVKFKAVRRRKAFEGQLSDVLGTISSSLKAGHSFNQALAAVINEAENPTAEEFQRAITEAGLGLPMGEALENMSERVGSDDFRFVVTTVNIQRTVGGSLAEILEMVEETVRGRQTFRKKVKALTSMGRASMWVLLGMPPAMAGILFLMNREYMAPLFYSDTGHMMMYVAGGLMFLGYIMCQKIVSVSN